MAGNRKINNQEQLASVRTKLNDNFEELSDAVTKLQPLTAVTDAGSDGFMRANADGTFDTIKTAPPDGGVGDNNRVQEMSNFAGKLPDVIFVSSSTGNIQRATFYGITNDGRIIYKIWSQNNYTCEFDNDDIGRNATFTGNASSWSFLNGAATLQDIIDSGDTVFYGQKSGTGGVGSLNAVKTDTNINLYTELPDAIVATTSAGYNAIMRLKFIKTSAGAANNEDGFFYESRYDTYSTSDFVITFKNDTDGTFNRSVGTTNIDTNFHKSLRWYIENGRALYYGGQQDFGVKAWGKFDGTGTGDLSFTGGNVASVTKVQAGVYRVTFTNPAPHADYSISGSANPSGYIGAYFGVQNNASITNFTINLRYNNDGNAGAGGASGDSDRISFQVVW